jgi:transketolase
MAAQESATLERPGIEQVTELARQLRADSIRCSTPAGSGHPTSSLSAADLMAVLLARHLRFDWIHPKAATNDRLVFSKGHASPLLYSMFKAAGAITDADLIDTYRRFGSRLQGHPTPALPWVEVATGSLGQGLPDAVGMALAGKKLDKLDYRVWVLCGDSEMAEGSIWEALDKAGYYGLNNLTVIVDVNRLGQTGPTEYQWDLNTYKRRVEAFGCLALEVDGHDPAAIDQAYETAAGAERPVAILAKTIKGKGVPEVEDQNGWHGKVIPPDIAAKAVAALGGARDLCAGLPPRAAHEPAITPNPSAQIELPVYELGQKVATRVAYGDALVALGARPEVVVLDGEVGNSTYSEKFKAAYPERFFEMYIAEQMMIGAAVGLSTRGYVPFASTFAAFLTRAYDFIRMAAVSEASIRLCGSHAGVEIGEDGPSQMGLEDIAMMRAVQGSTVLYPSDATSAAALTKQMADRPGIVYMRTTRGAYPVIYQSDEEFPIGGLKTVRSSAEDEVTLVGAGITLHQSLAAADLLAEEGIRARVIDLYSIKPLDVESLIETLHETDGLLVVAEDHHAEGGLGEAVMAALTEAGEPVEVVHLAVRDLPGSGKPAELLAAAGIAAADIAQAARELLGR